VPCVGQGNEWDFDVALLEGFGIIKLGLVGAITKQNFPIVVLPREKLPHNVDGLLGLDWLQDFHFIIDKKNALLRLTPISP
jgi:hypothetical protein